MFYHLRMRRNCTRIRTPLGYSPSSSLKNVSHPFPTPLVSHSLAAGVRVLGPLIRSRHTVLRTASVLHTNWLTRLIRRKVTPHGERLSRISLPRTQPSWIHASSAGHAQSPRQGMPADSTPLSRSRARHSTLETKSVSFSRLKLYLKSRMCSQPRTVLQEYKGQRDHC